MRNLLALTICAAVLVGSAPSARAEGSDAELALRLPGNLGLVGFGDMVDGRTPGLLSIRGGAQYQLTVRDRDFDGAVRLARKEQRHQVRAYLGVSFLSLFDVAARLPYIYDRKENNLKGRTDLPTKNDTGLGNVDLAGKISLKLGPFYVSPFLYGRLPSGEPEVRDLAEFSYGSAATFSLFNSYLSLHANLAGVHIEEGTSALRYRLGFAVVPWASSDFLVRLFAYGDGIEFEGSGDSDIDLEFGLQGVLFRLLTVSLTASLRVLDAGHLDDALKRELRQEQGVFDRHFEDDGTWGIQLSVGTTF